MKKKLTKIMALVLILSMLLPQTVFAATYTLTVTLEGPNASGTTQTVTRTSTTRYGSLQDNTLGYVATALYADGVDGEINKKFAGTGMRSFYEELVAAAQGTNNLWNKWVTDSVFGEAAQKALAKDATLQELWDLPTHQIVAIYKAKPQYTITITLNSHSDGSSGGGSSAVTPQEPTVEVKPVTDNSGTTAISNPAAKPGEKVSVTTKPAENKITGYVDVRDQNGNKVPLKYDGNGNYTFEMPEGGVTVETTYRPAPTDPKVSGVATLLNTDDHTAFMQGYPDGNFKPNGSITRAEVATIFYRLLRDQNVETVKSFNDIDGHWAATAVEVLSSLGIIKGMTEDTFAPQASITRAQFAAICARFATAVTNSDVTFTDVSASHWASAEIGTAAAYGWIYGKGDGNFDPDGAITRAEAAAIVNRMFARLGDQIAIDNGENRAFSDLNDTHWGWYEIAEATHGHDHTDEDAFVHEFWTE